MPYTSNRSPAGFVTPGTVANGQSARAAVLNNIANNQQWLAVNNTEMMTVFMGELTNATMRFPVRLNPYATWVEFYILCLKDMPANSTSQAGLTVTCGADTTLFVDIPYGEDYTTTGGTIENEDFGWVAFAGRVDDPTFGIGARALRADATPVNYYSTAECEITIASTVYVKTVCYRVLPGIAPYDVP